MTDDFNSLWQSLALLLRSHPWHGISIGEDVPKILNTYIETVPSDTVKYEIDKKSGFLKVDRPQKYSSICPTLYGFIPQTYCSKQVAELCCEGLWALVRGKWSFQRCQELQCSRSGQARGTRNACCVPESSVVAAGSDFSKIYGHIMYTNLD